jgi:hypothetical protein
MIHDGNMMHKQRNKDGNLGSSLGMLQRVFPMKAMEDELCVGPADVDGPVAGGTLDMGVLYLELGGAGASPREGRADCCKVHEEVRPTEILALLHDG